MPSSAETIRLEGNGTVKVGRGSPLVIERCTPGSFSDVHERMLADQRARAAGELPRDQLLLFSPDPVVTLGSGADAASDLLIAKEEYAERGVTLTTVDRGGEATYHGPGQRVGYLNLALGEEERDLHRLLRAVEEGLIATLATLGIEGSTIDGKTGVWIEDRKIASIGLSVRRWVTGHGFALCVAGDLEPFSWIVPCGLRDCRYTSIESELGSAPDRDELDRTLARELGRTLDRVPTPSELDDSTSGEELR